MHIITIVQSLVKYFEDAGLLKDIQDPELRKDIEKYVDTYHISIFEIPAYIEGNKPEPIKDFASDIYSCVYDYLEKDIASGGNKIDLLRKHKRNIRKLATQLNIPCTEDLMDLMNTQRQTTGRGEKRQGGITNFIAIDKVDIKNTDDSKGYQRTTLKYAYEKLRDSKTKGKDFRKTILKRISTGAEYGTNVMRIKLTDNKFDRKYCAISKKYYKSLQHSR